MGLVEHLLVARRGEDERSRHVVTVGVRLDAPDSVPTRLNTLDDDVVIEALRTAFEIRIAFSLKQRLGGFGADWHYAFLREVVRDTFDPRRGKTRRYALVAHLPAELSAEAGWLDPYLTRATYGRVRVRTETVAPDNRTLALPELVARRFHDAIEDDVGRPSAARDLYDALAPLVTHIEDIGLNVSYHRGGTVCDALVRPSESV